MYSSTPPTLEIELQSTPEIKKNNHVITFNEPSQISKSTQPRYIISTVTTTTLKSTSTSPKNKNSIEIVECPVWASNCVPLRNDHLKFYQSSDNFQFIVNLDEFKFIVLGRSSSVCHYILSHPTISRKHALIAHDYEGRLQIVDLNSMHGTFIDNKRISPSIPHTLSGGEKIRLGEDTSYFLVIKNSINQRIAQNLLEKKKSIVDQCNNNLNKPNNSNNNIISLLSSSNEDSQEVTDYKEEVLSFFSHLNKTDGLENDSLIQLTIDQLIPTGSPKKQKFNNRKRKLDHIAPNISSSKSIKFKETVQRYQFEYEDSNIENITIDQIPINYLNPHSNPTFSLFNILNCTNFSKFQQKQQENSNNNNSNTNDDENDSDDSDLENQRYSKRIKRINFESNDNDNSNTDNNSNNSSPIIQISKDTLDNETIPSSQRLLDKFFLTKSTEIDI